MKSLVLLLFCSAAFATTTIVVEGTTAQQIVLGVHSNKTCGAASLRVYEGTAAGSTVANDVNATYFTDSDNVDLRATNLVYGSYRRVVIGERRAPLVSGTGGVSRSLFFDTSYWIGVTCNGDAEVSTVTKTLNPRFGNTSSELYQYDDNSPTGYAWPSVDFSDKTKNYADPLTGGRLIRVTGPEDMATDSMGATTPITACIESYSPSGAGWTTATLGCGPGGTFAISTSTDPLFVSLGPVIVAGSAGRAASWDIFNSESISNLQIRITGKSAAALSNDAGVCITANGITCATATKNISLGVVSGAVDFPSSLTGYFDGWKGGLFQFALNNPDMAQRTGTVKCAGTLLTLLGGNTFNPVRWTTGSKITLTSTPGGCTAGVYTISVVNTSYTMTLTGSAGTSTTATPYTANNFGILIYPQGEVISIDNVTWMVTGQYQFTGSASGDGQFVNNNKKTTSGGVSGWIATLLNFSDAYAGYFIPATNPIGAARMIWSQWVPAISATAGDEVDLATLGSVSGGQFVDFDDPNIVYYTSTVGSRGEAALVKCTYNAAVGNYDAYVPASAQEQSPNFTCVNLTKHSVGGTLSERQKAFDSRFDLSVYAANPKMVNTRSGRIIIVNRAAQNGHAWFTVLNTSGTIVAMASTFDDACPFCPWHSFGDGSGTIIQWSTENVDGGQLQAKFSSTVVSINNSGAGTLDATTPANPSCTGVTDAAMIAKLPYGSGCDLVELTQEPCGFYGFSQPASGPACSWDAGLKGLYIGSSSSGTGKRWSLGTVMYDNAPGYGDNGAYSEMMLLVKNTTGNKWWVLRNYAQPSGAFLQTHYSVMTTHAANFVAVPGGIAGAAIELFWDYAAFPHGTTMAADFTYMPAAHGDDAFSANTAAGISLKSRNEFVGHNLAYSLRTGPLASAPGTAQNIGSSPNPSAAMGGLYGPAKGGGMRYCFTDSHGSVQSTMATLASGQDTTFVDASKPGAFASLTSAAVPGITTDYSTANPMTITQIGMTGTLYKVEAYCLQASLNIKYRPILMWIGVHNVKDVSGPASVLGSTSADNWKMCTALNADECVAGSSPGDLYVNGPGLNIEGTCANNTFIIYDAAGISTFEVYGNYPCVLVSSPELDSVMQGNWGYGYFLNGEYMRAIAHPFRTWFGSTAFYNARMMPDASGVLFSCDWCNNVRSDIFWAQLPKTPTLDSIVRETFVPIRISVGGATGDTVRIRFGYKENGPISSLYCTTRQEACATTTDTAVPFIYVGESAGNKSCGTGCEMVVNAMSGRVLFYVIDRYNGGNLKSSALQAIAVP